MMVANSIEIFQCSFQTKLSEALLRIITLTPWGRVSYWTILLNIFDMICYVTVSNRIFGILVDSYISAINAYRKKSNEWGKWGDVSLAPFSNFDYNYDYVSKAISVKFARGSSIQNISTFHTVIKYFILTLLHRVPRRHVLNHPSVHQQLSRINHTC